MYPNNEPQPEEEEEELIYCTSEAIRYVSALTGISDIVVGDILNLIWEYEDHFLQNGQMLPILAPFIQEESGYDQRLIEIVDRANIVFMNQVGLLYFE